MKSYWYELADPLSCLDPRNQKVMDQILIGLRFSFLCRQDKLMLARRILQRLREGEKRGLYAEATLETKDICRFVESQIQSVWDAYPLSLRIYQHTRLIPLILLCFTSLFDMLCSSLLPLWAAGSFSFTVPFTLSMLVNALLTVTYVLVLQQSAFRIHMARESREKQNVRMANLVFWLGSCLLLCLLVISRNFFTPVLGYLSWCDFTLALLLIMAIQQFYEMKRCR